MQSKTWTTKNHCLRDWFVGNLCAYSFFLCAVSTSLWNSSMQYHNYLTLHWNGRKEERKAFSAWLSEYVYEIYTFCSVFGMCYRINCWKNAKYDLQIYHCMPTIKGEEMNGKKHIVQISFKIDKIFEWKLCIACNKWPRYRPSSAKWFLLVFDQTIDQRVLSP